MSYRTLYSSICCFTSVLYIQDERPHSGSVWVYQKKKSGLIPVQVSWVHIRLVYSGQTVYVCVSGSAGQCSRGSDCHCLCNSVCRSSGKELMMVWMDCSNLSRSSSFTGSWCFLALICVGHINIERSFMQMSSCKHKVATA